MSPRADILMWQAECHRGRPRNPTAGLPDGRLKKRLRAAWRWRQVAGLLSLLWPFFQRFSLAETPEGNFPERPMLTERWLRLAREHASRAYPTHPN